MDLPMKILHTFMKMLKNSHTHVNTCKEFTSLCDMCKVDYIYIIGKDNKWDILPIEPLCHFKNKYRNL